MIDRRGFLKVISWGIGLGVMFFPLGGLFSSSKVKSPSSARGGLVHPLPSTDNFSSIQSGCRLNRQLIDQMPKTYNRSSNILEEAMKRLAVDVDKACIGGLIEKV